MLQVRLTLPEVPEPLVYRITDSELGHTRTRTFQVPTTPLYPKVFNLSPSDIIELALQTDEYPSDYSVLFKESFRPIFNVRQYTRLKQENDVVKLPENVEVSTSTAPFQIEPVKDVLPPGTLRGDDTTNTVIYFEFPQQGWTGQGFEVTLDTDAQKRLAAQRSGAVYNSLTANSFDPFRNITGTGRRSVSFIIRSDLRDVNNANVRVDRLEEIVTSVLTDPDGVELDDGYRSPLNYEEVASLLELARQLDSSVLASYALYLATKFLTLEEIGRLVARSDSFSQAHRSQFFNRPVALSVVRAALRRIFEPYARAKMVPARAEQLMWDIVGYLTKASKFEVNGQPDDTIFETGTVTGPKRVPIGFDDTIGDVVNRVAEQYAFEVADYFGVFENCQEDYSLIDGIPLIYINRAYFLSTAAESSLNARAPCYEAVAKSIANERSIDLVKYALINNDGKKTGEYGFITFPDTKISPIYQEPVYRGVYFTPTPNLIPYWDT